MSEWRVRFTVPAEVAVTVEADDEEAACDAAWLVAQDYLGTVLPDAMGSVISADLDGIGADTAEPVAGAR